MMKKILGMTCVVVLVSACATSAVTDMQMAMALNDVSDQIAEQLMGVDPTQAFDCQVGSQALEEVTKDKPGMEKVALKLGMQALVWRKVNDRHAKEYGSSYRETVLDGGRMTQAFTGEDVDSEKELEILQKQVQMCNNLYQKAAKDAKAAWMSG